MRFEGKPIVYVASPYTKGDACINTRCQMKMFDELMDDGVVLPYIPLLSHFQHTAFPRHYQDWIDYDLRIIDVMDACLRIDAEYKPMNYYISESSGADGEEDRFRKQDKPIFYNKEDLYKWVKNKS